MEVSLKLKRRVLKLDLYGEVVEMTFPNGNQLDEYRKEMIIAAKDESGKTDFDLTVDFLVKLGLSEEAGREMDIQDLEELVDVLTKKKER